MRLLFSLIILFLLNNCSKNEYVYWCGDHVCSNNKERIDHFKKTMVVEIRDLSEVNKKEISKERKKQLKMEAKKKRLEVKELKKQARLEKKIKLLEKKSIKKKKNIKKAKKQIDTDEEILSEIESEEILSEIESEEILSEIESGKNNTKVFKDSISEGADFDEIAKKILDVNKGKKYPNINFNE